MTFLEKTIVTSWLIWLIDLKCADKNTCRRFCVRSLAASQTSSRHVYTKDGWNSCLQLKSMDRRSRLLTIREVSTERCDFGRVSFNVKYPAFLHIWFSFHTFNIVIDCKIDLHAQRHTFWAFTSILSCCEDMFHLTSHLGSQLGYTCTSTILSITMFSFWITLEQAGFLKIQRVYNKSMAIVLSKSTLYLSSSPAFWITYLFSTHAV